MSLSVSGKSYRQTNSEIEDLKEQGNLSWCFQMKRNNKTTKSNSLKLGWLLTPLGAKKKQGLVSMFGNHTTYKNGDDWGMVQMALFYQNKTKRFSSSSSH